jgi:hypothetical protein
MSETRLDYATTDRSSGGSVAAKLSLAVGFLALAGGVLAAHGAPARGYELSPYAATPLPFWFGVGAALVVALAVVASGYRDAHAGVALTLGGGAVLAVVSLPVLRGYFFYGAADSLTHLGWAREVLRAALSPFSLVYPAGHLFAGAASLLLGIELRHALLFAVPVFVLLFFVFTVLTVRALVPERGAAVAGGFVAFLLLPVFNVGSSLMFVSFTLGLLFSPVFLYLLVVYVDRDSRRLLDAIPVTELDVAVFGTGVVLLLLHPQVFSDVLVVLGAVAFLQVLSRARNREGTIAGHRLVLGQFVVLSALFLAWNANHPAATDTIRQIIAQLTGSGEVGAIVQQRGASLTEIGAGLPVLFVKMFLVNVLVGLFAAWVVVRTLRGGTDRDALGAWVSYFTLGGALVGVYALLHFVGRTSSYFFRHLGFLMVIVSVLGALGIYLAGRTALQAVARSTPVVRGVTATGVVVALVALALSLAIVFPSPYVYSPSHHVPESSMNGYGAAFEHRADGVGFAGIRGGPDRYSDALAGAPDLIGDGIYGEEVRAGLGSAFETSHYLVVTSVDHAREVEAYRELRVTREDFRRIRSAVGVSRVMTNGDVDVYYVGE